MYQSVQDVKPKFQPRRKKLHNVGKTYYAAKGAVPCGIDVFVIDMSSNKPVRDARSLRARSIKSEHGGQIQTLAICGMSSPAPAELMGIGRYR
jgi:hypothetical protein